MSEQESWRSGKLPEGSRWEEDKDSAHQKTHVADKGEPNGNEKSQVSGVLHILL